MKTKNITEEMFALPNAGELIANLVKQGAEIDEEIQRKVFDLPDEKAAEIMLEYVKHGHELYCEAELKVFGLENAAEILLEYVKHYKLCDEARKLYNELMAKSAKG